MEKKGKYISKDELNHFLDLCEQVKSYIVEFEMADYPINEDVIRFFDKLETDLIRMRENEDIGLEKPNDPAVKFILEFLHHTKQEVLSYEMGVEYVENLQTSIKNGEIREHSENAEENSVYAKQIKWIQNYLVNKLNKADEEDEYEISLTIAGTNLFHEFSNFDKVKVERTIVVEKYIPKAIGIKLRC